MPRRVPAVETYNRLTAAFPQDGTTVDLVVGAAGLGARPGVAPLAAGRLHRREGDREVAGDAPDLPTAADRTVTVLALAVRTSGPSPAVHAAVVAVRADGYVPVVQRSLAGVPGARCTRRDRGRAPTSTHLDGAAAALGGRLRARC